MFKKVIKTIFYRIKTKEQKSALGRWAIKYDGSEILKNQLANYDNCGCSQIVKIKKVSK